MDKVAIIRRMRERNISWKDVAYCIGMNKSAAQKALKRANDIIELGERPVIKKTKFEAPVILKLKEIARNNPTMAVRDFQGELTKVFPGKLIPSKSTIHNILKKNGFKMNKRVQAVLKANGKVTKY